jgi:hypothetical protein
MTGRNATLLPRRWVVRANQADARAEKAEEPASEDDGPGRTFDDKQANDDEHGREDEPGPCSGLEDGHDDLPSMSYPGWAAYADRTLADGRPQVCCIKAPGAVGRTRLPIA